MSKINNSCGKNIYSFSVLITVNLPISTRLNVNISAITESSDPNLIWSLLCTLALATCFIFSGGNGPLAVGGPAYASLRAISKHNRLGHHSFLNGGAPQSWPRATTHLLSTHPPTTHHLASSAAHSPGIGPHQTNCAERKVKKHFQLLPQGTKRAHMISDMTRPARVCVCVAILI